MEKENISLDKSNLLELTVDIINRLSPEELQVVFSTVIKSGALSIERITSINRMIGEELSYDERALIYYGLYKEAKKNVNDLKVHKYLNEDNNPPNEFSFSEEETEDILLRIERAKKGSNLTPQEIKARVSPILERREHGSK